MSHFWETVAGVRLADTLNRTLPVLAERAEGKQYTIFVSSKDPIGDIIADANKKGHRYVDCIYVDGNPKFLVMSK